MSDQKKAPTNTKKRAEKCPEVVLMEAMTYGPSDAIVREEALGQQSFVGSDTLPTKMHGDAKEILEGCGVKFLGEVEGDPLFQYVELPQGWRKKGTGHAMWSVLVDHKGRERAAIFYKAAFYDRGAHLSVKRRFEATLDYDRLHQERLIVGVVTDCGSPVFETEPIEEPSDRSESFVKEDDARAEAVAWLEERYSDWQNPAAYWD